MTFDQNIPSRINYAAFLSRGLRCCSVGLLGAAFLPLSAVELGRHLTLDGHVRTIVDYSDSESRAVLANQRSLDQMVEAELAFAWRIGEHVRAVSTLVLEQDQANWEECYIDWQPKFNFTVRGGRFENWIGATELEDWTIIDPPVLALHGDPVTGLSLYVHGDPEEGSDLSLVGHIFKQGVHLDSRPFTAEEYPRPGFAADLRATEIGFALELQWQSEQHYASANLTSHPFQGSLSDGLLLFNLHTLFQLTDSFALACDGVLADWAGARIWSLSAGFAQEFQEGVNCRITGTLGYLDYADFDLYYAQFAAYLFPGSTGAFQLGAELRYQRYPSHFDDWGAALELVAVIP